MNIVANVSSMFSTVSPRHVSGSRAELGDSAVITTWRNAIDIAGRRSLWLNSGEAQACDGMREWARATGAWASEEVEAWSVDECIAMFVQNIAREIRMLGSDDGLVDLDRCVECYAETEWDKMPEYPAGHYSAQDGEVYVDYYAGL